jgi:sugar lactone lactonase YvrE
MNPLRKVVDRWFGRGEASITIPPMDGAFRPNDLLDLAPSSFEAPAPDCLAVTSQGVVVSSDRSLFSVDRPSDAELASFETPISALTGLPDGGAAVGLIDGRIVFVGGQHGGTTLNENLEVACITALAPASDGTLFVANGSATNGPGAWKRDLMEKNASGSVWRVDPRNGAYTRLAGGLAYPYGLLEDAGSVVVSESWRSALTRISPGADGRKEPALENLPAYPSRLSRAEDKNIWLALFAPRSQLVEFVLSENRYRRRMIREIDADYWVAPCLRSGATPPGADAAGRRQAARRAEAVVA